MASAKQTAINRLGSEDDYIGLKALNDERKVAQDTYNTNYNALQNAYNDLVSNVNSRRQQARTSFNEGRGTVANNNYMNTRGLTGDKLGARGVTNSMAQLGRFGSDMQVGKSNSNLANTYYNSLSDIQAALDKGTNEYNTNLETAKNTLSGALANIGTREANARNAYRQAVASLAEQIQSRWDSKALYNAQINYYKQQQEQALKDAQLKELQYYLDNSGYNKAKDVDKANALIKAANSYSKARKGTKNPISVQEAIRLYKDRGLVNIDDLVRNVAQANNKNKKSSNVGKLTNITYPTILGV